MSVKLLVCGDVAGNFGQVFSRVAAVNEKNGPFEMLLCVGDFFGATKDNWQTELQNASKSSIPTYILGPNKVEHVDFFSNQSGCELSSNVTFLGKSGILSGSSGLQIAYLSGVESHCNKSDFTHFTRDDLDTFVSAHNQKNFKGVDLLLSSQWPKDITKYAAAPNGHDPGQSGSMLLSLLATTIKPRYHFCGLSGVHYERQPYRNHKVLAEGARHSTRFISLAKACNATKKKWLYAFSITPLKDMDPAELVKQPEDITECPYLMENVPRLELRDSQAGKPQQFFYNLNVDDDRRGASKRTRGRGQSDGQERKRPKTKIAPLASCWFCLSSAQVEKHLVVSVGDHNYLALPKGGLVFDHLLILPIGHCQATTFLDQEALEEINSFKEALQKYFKSVGKTAIFFERNYKSHHMQIQVVPVPHSLADLVKETFLDTGDSQSIVLDEIPIHSDLKQIVKPGVPYFYVELPFGEKLLHRIRHNFPLQFGREVLASPPLLNLPDKVDWKNCQLSKEEEMEAAASFRKAFAPFDFTL